jgi:glutathione S-transferase
MLNQPMTVAMAQKAGTKPQKRTKATLTISSRNYSASSLRASLVCKFAGLTCEERSQRIEDFAGSFEPCLTHRGTVVCGVLAIAEYLNCDKPTARLVPALPAAAAHCRSICEEMHAGFNSLRSALPMSLKAYHRGFKVWAGAQADIDRIEAMWRDCLTASGGPFLFGARTIADAMVAPFATSFQTYDVALDSMCADYAKRIHALNEMIEWITAAKAEPDEREDLEAEF